MKDSLPFQLGVLTVTALLLVSCDKSDDVKPLTSSAQPDSVLKNPEIRREIRNLDGAALLVEVNELLGKRVKAVQQRMEIRQEKSRALRLGPMPEEQDRKTKELELDSDIAWKLLDQKRANLDRDAEKSDNLQLHLMLEQDDHLGKADKFDAESHEQALDFKRDPAGATKVSLALGDKARFELNEAVRLQRECAEIRAKQAAQK
ncbi:hypothetical protein [Luteolibacter sp. LG18]|uniref:hypothetical protein n=1 Tax=Luteolibacter sp. LG18 TaxID=2819286 RepID=UPI002B2F9409|nr:hypothetical protein llg_07200 [Luteolibacter sp. LG18]BCU79651.1 hypothetical protein llg_43660 [Luteolibacter sp. LG18]